MSLSEIFKNSKSAVAGFTMAASVVGITPGLVGCDGSVETIEPNQTGMYYPGADDSEVCEDISIASEANNITVLQGDTNVKLACYQITNGCANQAQLALLTQQHYGLSASGEVKNFHIDGETGTAEVDPMTGEVTFADLAINLPEKSVTEVCTLGDIADTANCNNNYGLKVELSDKIVILDSNGGVVSNIAGNFPVQGGSVAIACK